MTQQRLDLSKTTLREVNATMQKNNGSNKTAHYTIINPKGAHALACGLDAAIRVRIEGHTGYYCAGMNQQAQIHVVGHVGQGVAENMMSGEVVVEGDASQSAGATAHGGLLVIKGSASARCGISLKGGNIVVAGSVGHMSMFMAQSGNLVVLGDAGEALGDSLYEANIFVMGKVKSLGADCQRSQLDSKKKELVEQLLATAKCTANAKHFQLYTSKKSLYHFQAENIDAY